MTTLRKPGRPPLPPGHAKDARVEWRTHPDTKARAMALAAAAGMSLSQWIDRLVMRARSR